MTKQTLSKAETNRIISEAREWESVAEALNLQNSILYTVTDSTQLNQIPELSSILKLLEHTADELHALYLKCEKKHNDIRKPMFAEELCNG